MVWRTGQGVSSPGGRWCRQVALGRSRFITHGGKKNPPDSWKGMLRRGFLGPRWERRLPSRASVFGFKFTASLLLGWQTAEVWGQGRKGSGHARFLPCQLCRCLPGAPLSSGRVSKQGGGLQRHSSRNAVIDAHCWTAVLGWTKPVSKVFERTGCGPGAVVPFPPCIEFVLP